MKKEKRHHSTPLLILPKDKYNPKNPNEKAEKTFLAYDQDTGHCFVETSPADRKTEINPIGYFIRYFDSVKEAHRVKSQILRRPFLVHKYLNIP